MRRTAGILMIISGLLGGSLWLGIAKSSSLPALQIILFLPSFLAVMGGYYALTRTRWRWALAGAIFSLLFPFTGIPAIILLVKSKGEFLT